MTIIYATEHMSTKTYTDRQIPLEILPKASHAICWLVVLVHVDSDILMCSYRERVSCFVADSCLWPQVPITFSH